MFTEIIVRDIFEYFKTHFVPSHTNELYLQDGKTFTPACI